MRIHTCMQAHTHPNNWLGFWPVFAELLADIQTHTCSNIVYTMLLPWRHNLRGSDSPMQSHWAITLELWVPMMRSSRSVTMPPVWVVCQCWSTLLFNNTENTLKTHWGNTKHYSPSGSGLWFYSLTLFDVIKKKPTLEHYRWTHHYLFSNLCCLLYSATDERHANEALKDHSDAVSFFFFFFGGDHKWIIFCEWRKWAGFLSGWH